MCSEFSRIPNHIQNSFGEHGGHFSLDMGALDIHCWIFFGILTVFLTLLSSMECIPLNSKAVGWMNTKDADDEGSYSHIAGSSKFVKSFVSQPPRSSYHTAAGNTSNRTLAAILLLTVFGLAATALLVILCSKMTKKEQYDNVKGTIY